MRQFGTGRIIVYEVVFKQDCVLCRADGGKKCLKKICSPAKKFHIIVTVSHRQLKRTQPPQQADETGETFFMMEVVIVHVYTPCYATGMVKRPTVTISAVMISPP